VLLTSRERQGPNIRRLESVLASAKQIELTRDNAALIAELNTKLGRATSAAQRAKLLCEIGHWYRDMGSLDEARAALEESLALNAASYTTITELVALLATIRDKRGLIEALGRLMRLDPRNPTVYNELLAYASGILSDAEIVQQIDRLQADHRADAIVQATCDFYAGQVLTNTDPVAARRRLVSARRTFEQEFPTAHPVFTSIRLALRQLPRVR